MHTRVRPARHAAASAGPAVADLGFPLYTLPFGQARGLGQARDVAIKDLRVKQNDLRQEPAGRAGTARVEGFVNQDVLMQLLFETRRARWRSSPPR